MGRPSKALKQAYNIADVVYARTQDVSVPNEDLTKLVASWDTIVDRMRVLRGRPLPGSLKPVQKRKVRRAPSMTLDEPAGPQDDAGDGREPGAEPGEQGAPGVG